MKILLTSLFCGLAISASLVWGNPFSLVSTKAGDMQPILEEMVQLLDAVSNEGSRYREGVKKGSKKGSRRGQIFG